MKSVPVYVMLMLGFNVSLANYVIQDAAFDAVDWSIAYTDYQNLTASAVVQNYEQQVEGSDNGVLFVETIKPAGTSGTWKYAAAIIYTADSYDPAAQGALEEVNFSFKHEMRTVVPAGYAAVAPVTSVVLEQDGKYYMSVFSTRDSTNNGVFTTFSGSTTDAAVWKEEIPNGVIAWDAMSHPDFSSTGAPIHVGLMYFLSSSYTIEYPASFWADDFSVEFVSVPEPAAMSLMALGLLFARRKRSH